MSHIRAGGAALLLLAGCATNKPAASVPPAELLGAFEDDYGIAYTLTGAAWTQHPGTVYHVAAWHPEDGYLIARNDSANANGGLWTRIDWIALDGMEPYTWAFCLSTYDAPTAEAAENTRTARRDMPRTGCNGYPFSRMKPRPEGNQAGR